jgi:hypothetical protein
MKDRGELYDWVWAKDPLVSTAHLRVGPRGRNRAGYLDAMVGAMTSAIAAFRSVAKLLAIGAIIRFGGTFDA